MSFLGLGPRVVMTDIEAPRHRKKRKQKGLRGRVRPRVGVGVGAGVGGRAAGERADDTGALSDSADESKVLIKPKPIATAKKGLVCCIVLYCILYCIVLYIAVYCSILQCIVLYCIVYII
jgi:hypothetical protein